MKLEKLIAKKVKHHFSAKEKQVLFDVNSLEEHYDGLLIHKSDIIYLEEGELVNGYVRAGDVNMDNAVSKEVVEDSEETGMTYEEAEQLTNTGHLIALPEWKGFWFKNIKTGELLVVTKEGQIVNTPFDEFKERNDWKTVDPTEEQAELLESYWEEFEKQLKENTKTNESTKEAVDSEVIFDRKFEEEPISVITETVAIENVVQSDYQEEVPVVLEEIKVISEEVISSVKTPKKKAAAKK